MNSKLTKEEFLEKLKTDRDFNNRYGRKHITEEKMVLPPCHYGFQCYTRELSLEERFQITDKINKEIRQDLYSYAFNNPIYTGGINQLPDDVERHKLLDDLNVPKRAISLMWNQRSVDTFLGLPFNIASYALLLEIIAQEVNMVPDELIGNLGDVHLYSNHVEQAKEQIGREMTISERMDWWFENRKPNRDVCDHVDTLSDYAKGVYFDECGVPSKTREPFQLPKLWINTFRSDTNTIIGDIEKWSHEHFKIEGYQSHPSIKAPLSN